MGGKVEGDDKGKLLAYTCVVKDYKWVTKDGQEGKWRGPAWKREQVPWGPKITWGSRLGASVDARSKGVYFGNPGLPRCTFATTKVEPSLGPAMGLPKSYPPRVSEPFPQEYGTHLDDKPVAFVLEGVVGFNPNKAKEILKLREQLVTVEHLYQHEDRKLRKEIKSSQSAKDKLQKEIYEEDISRRDMEDKKKDLAKELRDIRKMVDEQAAELKAFKKETMRQQLKSLSSTNSTAPTG